MSSTVASDYINTMKTTYEFNFHLIKLLNSMDTQKHGSQENLSMKKFLFDYLETCKSKKAC